MSANSPSGYQGPKRLYIRGELQGLQRCPHCGIANPQLVQTWSSDTPVPRATPGPVNIWAAYRCTSCGDVVLAKGADNETEPNPVVSAVFPAPKAPYKLIPPLARVYLQQAKEKRSPPDARTLAAGSAVDAMLKQLEYTGGNLYERIDQAVKDGVLTKAIGAWAHTVRLGQDRPYYSDKGTEVSNREAEQAVAFAETLGFFLFVLTERIKRRTAAAKNETASEPTDRASLH